jgi:hypothetical protein
MSLNWIYWALIMLISFNLILLIREISLRRNLFFAKFSDLAPFLFHTFLEYFKCVHITGNISIVLLQNTANQNRQFWFNSIGLFRNMEEVQDVSMSDAMLQEYHRMLQVPESVHCLRRPRRGLVSNCGLVGPEKHSSGHNDHLRHWQNSKC